MANEVNLNLDPRGFMNIVPERMAAIEKAPDTPLPEEYPTDRLMSAFHPRWQYAKIRKAESHGKDAKSYTLEPDSEKGTNGFACFSAGQYVCVSLAIGGSRLLRPYRICSSPADALRGIYVLTVKRPDNGPDNGFASAYILDNWVEGGKVTLTGPEGNFTYEPLRDKKHIIGIADSDGIMPFYSLACAIADGCEDCSLTLLYGNRSMGDILLKEQFDAVSAKTDKVRVVYALGDGQAQGYEHGPVTAELIKKYTPSEDYSVFMCGSRAMYEFCKGQIDTLCLPSGRVRYELLDEYIDPSGEKDYPGVKGESFTLTVVDRGIRKEVPCVSGESLLAALERAGMAVYSRCRNGECGYCNARLLAGEVFVPADFDKRLLADAAFKYIHTCVSFPLGDVTVEVPGNRIP